MASPAYLSDELDLTESQRAGAALDLEWAQSRLSRWGVPQPTAEDIIQALRKRGVRDDSYLAAALILSLEDYRRVEEVYQDLPAPSKGWRH